MKEMIKRVREEKGGFTLAELLIVVAILLVLIAIAVPMFTGALGKAEEAVDKANSRSATSEAKVAYQLEGKSGEVVYTYAYDGDGNELVGSGEGDGTSITGDAVYKYTVTVSKADAGDNKGDVTVKCEGGKVA